MDTVMDVTEQKRLNEAREAGIYRSGEDGLAGICDVSEKVNGSPAAQSRLEK